MEDNKFKKLLFDIACATMASDGSIDKQEIEKLEHMAKYKNYFNDSGLNEQLGEFVKKLKLSTNNNIIEEKLNGLKNKFLQPLQELLILEVVLGIIYADTKIHKEEIEFAKKVRALLRIGDEIIIDRFGKIDFLISVEEVKRMYTKEKKASINFQQIHDMYHIEEDEEK